MQTLPGVVDHCWVINSPFGLGYLFFSFENAFHRFRPDPKGTEINTNLCIEHWKKILKGAGHCLQQECIFNRNKKPNRLGQH